MVSTCGCAMLDILLDNGGKTFLTCFKKQLTKCCRCTFFQWAEFDEDGEPPWAPDFKQPKIIA